MATDTHIDEANGSGQTVTHSISNSNYGSTDAASMVAADNPITPNAGGAYKGSYDKWQKVHVVSLAGVTKVKNIKFWRFQGTPTGSDLHRTFATHTSASYSSQVYTTPTTALFSSTQSHDVMSSEPASANIGINSSLTGEITNLGTNSASDYIRHQVQVSAGTTQGATLTNRYQWDEIA